MESRIFEMTDIFEGGYLLRREGEPFIDDVIAKNIKELLVREGVISEDDSVIIPVGAYTVINCDESSYQYDFEVFAPDGNTIKFYGTAYGRCECYEKEGKTWVELIDMTVEIKP